MAESSLPSPADSSEALTLVEKIVEVRLLVLALAFLFYVDIWVLHAQIDPMTFTAEDLTKHLQAVPVFKLVLFVVSFSVLLGALFPALRFVCGLLYLTYGPSRQYKRTGRDANARRLSNWAFGLVALSMYDFVYGQFFAGTYQGAANYLGHVFEANSFEMIVFRVTCIGFWLVCLAMAFEIDD